jgi:hypothetical protein
MVQGFKLIYILQVKLLRFGVVKQQKSTFYSKYKFSYIKIKSWNPYFWVNQIIRNLGFEADNEFVTFTNKDVPLKWAPNSE